MRFIPTMRLAYQPDILEWTECNKASLQNIREKKDATKSSPLNFRKYFSSGADTSNESAVTPASTEASSEVQTEEPKLGESLMQQYYQSQELRNVLKWKRISWDKGVDYEGLSQRLIESSQMLSKQRAFSFLGVHFTRDEATKRVNSACGVPKEAFVPSPLHEIASGTLCSWYATESDPRKSSGDNKTTTSAPYVRLPPFSMCWETGKVNMLDSISPEEVLYFLENFAPRAQQTQLQIENEQTRLHEAVENVRFRCTLDALKFNEEDQALRDRKAQEDSKQPAALSPVEVLQFCESMLKTAWLYRHVLRGHQIRIGLPGTAYHIDDIKGELTIPCDFDRYSWMTQHETYLRHETIANSYRNHWYVWLFLATFLMGDLDVI